MNFSGKRFISKILVAVLVFQMVFMIGAEYIDTASAGEEIIVNPISIGEPSNASQLKLYFGGPMYKDGGSEFLPIANNENISAFFVEKFEQTSMSAIYCTDENCAIITFTPALTTETNIILNGLFLEMGGVKYLIKNTAFQYDYLTYDWTFIKKYDLSNFVLGEPSSISIGPVMENEIPVNGTKTVVINDEIDDSGIQTTADFTNGMANISFTPRVVGTYELSIAVTELGKYFSLPVEVVSGSYQPSISTYSAIYENGVYIRDERGEYLSIGSSVINWLTVSGSGMKTSSQGSPSGTAIVVRANVDNAAEGDVIYLNSGRSKLYEDVEGSKPELVKAGIFQNSDWVNYTGELPAPTSVIYTPSNESLVTTFGSIGEQQAQIVLNSPLFIKDYEGKQVEATHMLRDYLNKVGVSYVSIGSDVNDSITTINLNMSGVDSEASITLAENAPNFYVYNGNTLVPWNFNMTYANEVWSFNGEENPHPPMQNLSISSIMINGRSISLSEVGNYAGSIQLNRGETINSVSVVLADEYHTTYQAIVPSSIPGTVSVIVSSLMEQGVNRTYNFYVYYPAIVVDDDSSSNSNSNTSTPTVTPPPAVVSAVNNALNQITAQLNPDAALDGTGNVADSVFKANEDFLDKLKEISPDKIIESVDKIQDQLIKNKEIFEKAQTVEDKLRISRQMFNVIEESLKKSGTLETKPVDKMVDDMLVQMSAPKKTEIEKALKNLNAMDAALKETATDTLGEREAANVKKKLTVTVEPVQSGTAQQPNAGVELTQDITKFIQESQVQQLDIDLGAMSYGIPAGELNGEANDSTFLANAGNIPPAILVEEQREFIVAPLELSYLENGERVDEFENPVTLSFDLNKYFDDISKLNPDELAVIRLDEENNLLESVGGRFNPETGEIVSYRQHLSTYTVAKSNKSFSDVNDSWAKAEINAMLNKGIIKDTGKGFQPTAKMTREELVSWISKTYGLKEKDITLSFTDVDKKSPYYKEIAAAYDLGIISGKDGKTFDPKAAVTRQEVATVVMRAKTKFEAENMVKEIEKSLASNSDKDKVADWAKSSVATATEKGILTASAGNINPTAEVSKEEAANMIYKAYYKQ